LGLCGNLFAQSVGGTTASSEPTELEKEITERAASIEITRLETKDPLYSIELRNAGLNDFFRLLAHDYDMNVLVDDRVAGYITASFTNLSLEAALDNIAEMYGLLLEKNKDVIKVKPNLITKTIVFKHVSAESFLNGLAATSLGSQATAGSTGGTSSTVSGSEEGLATVYDLLSELGKIFLGKQRNLIMVIDYPENVKRIENFAQAVDGSMDTRIFKLKYISSKEIATEFEEDDDEGFVLEGVGSGSSSSSSSSGSSN
ncbi:MAG: hypothetical protein ABIH45_01320, partial [Candidatus Omnitrophota bacterium]